MISCSYSTFSLGSWTATSIYFCFLKHSNGISSYDFICRSIIPTFWLLKFVCNELYKLAHYLNATKLLENCITHFLFGKGVWQEDSSVMNLACTREKLDKLQ